MIMQPITHNLKRINWFIKTLAGIILVIILAACAPAADKTPEAALPQPTATAVVTPTPAATATPSPTPTPEVAEPSIPHGLRPENAATQTYENGVWTVKNADGQTTATWNEQVKEWTYQGENIKVSYTKIGFEPDDPSFLAPLIEPLPPDDPSTHFIDPATGKPVSYGIGPETQFTSNILGVEDSVTYPMTQVFTRFHGFVQDPQNKNSLLAVFEVPHSPDRTTLIVQEFSKDYVAFVGIPDGTIVYDYDTTLYEPDYLIKDKDAHIQQLNERYIGNMVMILIKHDFAHMLTSSSGYVFFLHGDEFASAILQYLSGETTTIPSYGFENNVSAFILNEICVPENQFINDFD